MPANQNVTQLTQQTGSAAASSLFYAVTGGTTDTGLPLSVLVNNLGLTGVPTAPTATTGTNTTQLSTTAFVQAQLTSTLASYALIASPTFTGTVTIPTIALSGGAINSTTVGATTPSTGAFTTLSSSGLASLSSLSTSSATLTGGTINSMSVGATTASTGKFTTLQATSAITPSTTAGIIGTTAADNATAGSIGEIITASTSTTAASTGVPLNATSVSLTAGDWDVTGIAQFNAAATTLTQSVVAGINTTSATFGTVAAGINNYSLISGISNNASTPNNLTAPVTRVNVSTTTTVYLVAQVGFTTSTMTVSGFIRARRVR